MLLFSSLLVTAAGAQDKESEVEVSYTDEDLGLDEEELKVLMAEREEEEETLTDKDNVEETDGASGKDEGDSNVSFQVGNLGTGHMWN